MCPNKSEILSPVPKVSVIVAAYNAESYLCRALEGLMGQTLSDFEVIIVDDGSSDDTGKMADQCARRDPRVRVIHKSNGGVASARQAGLEKAKGEYITHVDADDWLERDMLEGMYMYAIQQNADILICDFESFTRGGGTEYFVQKPKSFEPETVLGQMMVELPGCLWNKLIRRSAIEKYHVRFDESLRICEDQFFVMQLLLHPVKIAYLNKAYYHYDRTQNPASLVNRQGILHQRLIPIERISELTDSPVVLDYYRRALTRMAYDDVRSSSPLSWKEYKRLFSRHIGEICLSRGFPFHVKLLLLLRLCGFNLFRIINA